MSNLTEDQVNEIIGICAKFEAKYGMVLETIPTEQAAYIIEVMVGVAWRFDDAQKRIDGYAKGQERAFQKAQNADDTNKSLRATLASNEENRQNVLLRIAKMLELIVETPVTHGQKNGMILLVREIAIRASSAYHDIGDIPF